MYLVLFYESILNCYIYYKIAYFKIYDINTLLQYKYINNFMNYKIFPTINYRIKKKPVLIKKDFKIKYKIQRLKYKFKLYF